MLLELLVDMTSRLYPRIRISGQGTASRATLKTLRMRAKAINPEIEFLDEASAVSVRVVVGSPVIPGDEPRIFAGSDGWIARLSSRAPVSTGRSRNPFGAGAAACFALANVFRLLFAAELSHPRCDTDIELSVLNMQQGKAGENPRLGSRDLGETHLVGVGAIGNAAVWALSKLQNKGTLHLVDHEAIELSNLQRYVSTTQATIGVPKVRQASKSLAGTGFKVIEHPMRWAEYVKGRADFKLDRVAVALDNVPDRLEVQGSLPRRVLNSWTQPGDLGVSRHSFLGHQACMACLYLPTGKQPDLDELVAQSLGLVPHRMMVRQLLYSNAPIGRAVLQLIAQAKSVPLDSLAPFEGKPLRVFYQNAICGGIVLSAGDNPGTRGSEVPMSFQSALAGVLLAAEVVADATGLRHESFPVATRVNLLAPLSEHLTFEERKRSGNRCICQDDDYVAAYRAKYTAEASSR